LNRSGRLFFIFDAQSRLFLSFGRRRTFENLVSGTHLFLYGFSPGLF